MFGLFRRRRKPKTAPEDIVVTLLNSGEKVIGNGVEANVAAPITIMSAVIALKKKYGLEPESDSLMQGIVTAQQAGNDDAMWEGIERVQDLLRMSAPTDYDTGLAMLQAYMPAMATQISLRRQPLGERTWRQLAADLGAAMRTAPAGLSTSNPT